MFSPQCPDFLGRSMFSGLTVAIIFKFYISSYCTFESRICILTSGRILIQMITEDRKYSNIRAIFKYRAQALHAGRTAKRPLASNKASGEHFYCLDDKVGAGWIRTSQKRLFSSLKRYFSFIMNLNIRVHVHTHTCTYIHAHTCVHVRE